ncbi:ABC transporter ATP-binding protein [Paenibacillaceae bacterium]|nr:ABC transporter ATP-binding protein [Paenibacillaceae bacterium]
MAGLTSSVSTGRSPLLTVQGLTHAFEKDRPLFDNLNFTVYAGEFVALLAPSGMGKTTLFRLLAGLLTPQSGTIALGAAPGGSDTDAGNSVARSAPLGKIGYMPQRDCLMPWRTVLDNAALGLELQGLSLREARRQVLELLPAFGLEGTQHKYPHELSGGMRQRVSFVRSLLGGGDVLLLDEPFSALDAMMRVTMQEWLLKVWERHRKTILFITHDVDEALLLADRVLISARSPVTVMNELIVDLPRPRAYEAVLDERFLRLKRQALQWLGREAGNRAGGGKPADAPRADVVAASRLVPDGRTGGGGT